MKYILLLLLTLSALNAESSVWKVSKGENVLYLGGTIHLLKQSDYPLPLEFDAAYNRSDILVFEADLDATKEESFMQNIVQLMRYSEGKSLRTVLSKEVYIKLKKEALNLGIDMAVMDQFKVSMIIMSLTMVELQKAGVNAEGVDAHYLECAKEDVKRTLFLESVASQVRLIANMGQGHEDEMVLQTLNELKDLASGMQEITHLWRVGDIKGLEKLLLRDMMLEFPALYEEILVKRNREWMPKIVQMLETEKSEFVLVGTMHLVGPDGLLSALKKRGYSVEQL